MARTPGVLNPEEFSSDEAFKEALDQQGAAAGWTVFDPAEFEED